MSNSATRKGNTEQRHKNVQLQAASYIYTQSDTKVSPQWTNGLFIYTTCSLWVPFHCYHKQLRISSHGELRWCYPRTRISDAFF